MTPRQAMTSVRDLSHEDARQIAANVTGFFAVLAEWSRAEMPLPANDAEAIVLAHGDDLCESAARDCAVRWKRRGRRVRIAHPPQGMDFNDMLAGRALRIEEGAR